MSDQANTAGPVVIAGGSGFLGISLATHLVEHGHRVILLARHAPRPQGDWHFVAWDARTLGDWTVALEGASGLVNLVGRSVDCIKTPARQDEILRSRVEPTLLLGAAMQKLQRPPPVWVQMSTAHIYGDPPDVVCTEGSALGYGLAPYVAQAWENAFRQSALPTQRQVILRTSFVIGRDRGVGGGALARLAWLARFGLGGTVGSGTQGMSWIHETDLNRLFERAITDANMQGVYIASSPNPVSQRDFSRHLRRATGMPIGLPAWPWLVKIAAPLMMKTDPDLALYGRYVVPQRLLAESFDFRFSELPAALQNLLA